MESMLHRGWAADLGEPRLSRQRTLGMKQRIRRDADEGHHVGFAKYRGAWTYGPARLCALSYCGLRKAQ
jgi:hypothetical protein